MFANKYYVVGRCLEFGALRAETIHWRNRGVHEYRTG